MLDSRPVRSAEADTSHGRPVPPRSACPRTTSGCPALRASPNRVEAACHAGDANGRTDDTSALRSSRRLVLYGRGRCAETTGSPLVLSAHRPLPLLQPEQEDGTASTTELDLSVAASPFPVTGRGPTGRGTLRRLRPGRMGGLAEPVLVRPQLPNARWRVRPHRGGGGDERPGLAVRDDSGDGSGLVTDDLITYDLPLGRGRVLYRRTPSHVRHTSVVIDSTWGLGLFSTTSCHSIMMTVCFQHPTAYGTRTIPWAASSRPTPSCHVASACDTP